MENTFFDYLNEINEKKDSPLANRLRPTTINEIVGQKDILAEDKLLYKMIKNDYLSSIILYGPTGSGKTTIAKVIANMTKSNFFELNATNASKKDMEEIVAKAKNDKSQYNKKTILFIDEIHRFNKAQQDYLLPFVENATIILIGATTENPYFEVNNALLSRSKIFELNKLSKEDIMILIDRACNDIEKGLGALDIVIDDDAKNFLAEMSNGDARGALNAIELISRTTDKDKNGKIHITIDLAKDAMGKHGYSYDKDGDTHYDTISAFIKSMRGSDENATVYYLARMLLAGEDIKFIARRIMICASEDVGMADPMALVVATNASLAVERVGLPEARIILAEAATYVARAKKDNSSYMAIENALSKVKETGNLPIPNYLRDAHYNGAKDLNRGIGYKYPHDYKGHFVEQQYLPDEIKDEKFFID